MRQVRSCGGMVHAGIKVAEVLLLAIATLIAATPATADETRPSLA